jgi:predicted secreted acid phosphatase
MDDNVNLRTSRNVDLQSIFEKMILKVVENAKLELQDIIQKNSSKSKCVIFDIDDTLVTNQNNPIKHVINLYKYISEDLKIKIFIITARRQTNEYQTRKLLEDIKIDNYENLFLRSNYYMKNVSFYKYEIRREISENYSIIANIGNYYSDFFGGFNGLIVRIPTLIECMDQII